MQFTVAPVQIAMLKAMGEGVRDDELFKKLEANKVIYYDYYLLVLLLARLIIVIANYPRFTEHYAIIQPTVHLVDGSISVLITCIMIMIITIS